MNIEYWAFNGLAFSIAPLSYIIYYQYKDIKKLRNDLRISNNYIKYLEDNNKRKRKQDGEKHNNNNNL